MPSDHRDRRRERSRDRSDRNRSDRDKDRSRDDRRRDDRRRDDKDRNRSRDEDRSRKDSDKKSRSRSPVSRVPRAKTPPLGGSGGFFVRGGVQKSTMKKSDNIDDHVFMPGEKIGDAFMLEEEEETPVADDGATAVDRDMRDAQRAEGGDEYQKKMYEAAQDFYGTKERNELKMTVARVQSGYRAGGGIRANEIKGFLNIWCNQRRLKPEYEFIERGKPPKGTFICRLTIESFDYVAETEARTKREAQADAAWDFANKLCEMGYCNPTDLPNKTMATVNNQGCVPTEWKSVLTDEMIKAAGNWTPDNCRKRLSMFCNFEKISCEIVNSALGPDHAKIAIAELKLTLRKYGKEFYAKEQARTKKLANSLVAWSIMKQLHQADMIEGFGERLKRAADSKVLKAEAAAAGTSVGAAPIGNDITVDTGMDANTGDWTLDSSRTRLHEYFQQRGIEVEYDMQEIGYPPDRVYTAHLHFEIDGKRYKSFYECENKKMTQKKTAFDIMVQLYRDGKVEPNTGRRNWGDGPSGNLLGCFPFPQNMLQPPGHMMSPRDRDEFCVKMKLQQITPNPNFANVVNSTLMMIENSMKAMSDEMLAEKRSFPENAQKSDEDLRELLGVMRVGALSVNTVLTNEAEFLLIMMMKEKPTISMLVNVARRLDQKVPHEPDFNFMVKPDIPMGVIELVRESDPSMIIFVKITSSKCRPDYEEEIKKEEIKEEPKTEIKPETPAEIPANNGKPIEITDGVKTEETAPVEPKAEPVEQNGTNGEVKVEPEVNEPEVPPEKSENGETVEKPAETEKPAAENSTAADVPPETPPPVNVPAVNPPENPPVNPLPTNPPPTIPPPGSSILGNPPPSGQLIAPPPGVGIPMRPGMMPMRPGMGGPPMRMGTPPFRPGTPPFRPGTPPMCGTPPPFMGTPPHMMGTPPPRMGTPPPHLMPPGRMGTPPPHLQIMPPGRMGSPPPHLMHPGRVGTPPPMMGTPPPMMGSPMHIGTPPQKLGNDKYIDNELCSQALAELRHSKWFQSCAATMPNAIPIIRLFRDLCQRVRTWSILSDWQLNLLIQKSLESANMPMLPSDGLRRVFSSVAGGVLLNGGLGIADPCEKEDQDDHDAFANFSEQDREDLTASAQHALRLICFGEMHKILGIQPPQ